jgi:hypothetical protein
MIGYDPLRPPGPYDPRPEAYKDWLHLNVFDPGTGLVGLCNVSLHGDPTDPRSRAVGAALVHLPDLGWVGDLAIRDIASATLGPTAIGLDQVGLSVHHASGRVDAAATFPDEGLSVRATGHTDGPPITVELRLPLGSGWVSWYVVPHLRLTGEVEVLGGRVNLDGAYGYHDHNWGRWHWGDDLGWDWGSFVADDGDVDVVVARTTDRDHRSLGPATLSVRVGSRRRRFSDVSIDADGEHVGRTRRVPGALAALHAQRADPRLPSEVIVTAHDGDEHLEVRFHTQGTAQLVTADPVRPGASFVHELAGHFTATGYVLGRELRAAGLGVVERVD